jgi:hypothetical protein
MKIHESCFLIGWVYYHFIPYLLVRVGYFESMTPANGLNSHYIAYASIVLVSFFTGTLFARRVKLTFNRSIYYQKKHNNKIIFCLILITLVLLPMLIRNVNVGYGEHSNPYLGFVSTLVLIFSFLIVQQIDIYDRFKVNWLFLIFCILSFYLFLSGARLFAITGILLISIASLKKGILKLKKFILLGLFLVLALVILGQWRLGISISSELFSFYLFAEAILLSHSSSSYFHIHDIQLINVNQDIFASMLNLIPSLVFQNKADFYVTLSSQGVVASPFGGMNLLVSLAANFGLIGSFLAIFCFGALIERAGSVENTNRGSLPMYSFLCAFSVFLLNREAFVTQHKVVIVLGLIFAITVSLRKVSYVER